MTVELIDGRAGKPHIGGDDLGNFKAGFVGIEGYVLETENKLAATLESANKLTINTGAAIMPTTGRHVRITSPETVTIQSGTQGQKRNDLVVLRTATSSDNTTVETANIIVIKGTPTTGTPTDPSINNGDLKLYRLSLDGISVENPVPLFNVLTPLATLGASVDQIKVEQRGTSGIWEYAKYSNGIAECWGIDYTGSFNINTLWGNGFYISDNIAARNYPFTFKSSPREFAQITLVNPANHNTVYTGIKSLQAVNSTSKTCAYQMLRSGSGTGFAAKIEYYVRGEWK